jgi:uncharacterized membrane protein YeiH
MTSALALPLLPPLAALPLPEVHPRLHISQVMGAMETLAIFAYAVSGLIEARRRRLDVVGAFIVAFLTAFGGGTLRDLLLERRPFYWVEHQNYVLIVFILSLAAPLMLNATTRVVSRRALLVADAIGLGLFSVAGTSMAIDMGMPMFTAVMMGVITGVFGGVLRDVLCNEVPLILRDSRPYATCAFLGCWVYIALQRAGISTDPAAAIATAFILAARLVTYKLRVRLPR